MNEPDKLATDEAAVGVLEGALGTAPALVSRRDDWPGLTAAIWRQTSFTVEVAPAAAHFLEVCLGGSARETSVFEGREAGEHHELPRRSHLMPAGHRSTWRTGDNDPSEPPGGSGSIHTARTRPEGQNRSTIDLSRELKLIGVSSSRPSRSLVGLRTRAALKWTCGRS